MREDILSQSGSARGPKIVIEVSKRIRHQYQCWVRANFAGPLAVDALGVGLAACGLLGPLFAAFLHVASELTFLLNAARLLPTRRAAHVGGTSACAARDRDARGGREDYLR